METINNTSRPLAVLPCQRPRSNISLINSEVSTGPVTWLEDVSLSVQADTIDSYIQIISLF